MDLETVMKELESLGTEQNRKVFPRHGVKGALFGVSFKDIGILSKRIKKDSALAKDLWSTKNHDARILSTMIMDPIDLERPQLIAWANELDNYVITDAFVKMVFQSEQAYPLMLEWISSDKEFISAAGWNMVALYAMEMNDEDDRFFLDFLETIEKTIHSSPNRTRYNMNNALIAIGARNEILKDAAIKVAEVVGKVEVDHGQTSCKTPDARSYIIRTFEHKKKREK